MLVSDNKPLISIEKVVDMQRFSSKGRLLRCIGWMLRFISNMKSAILKSELNHEFKLTVSEVNEAGNVLIKSIQNDCFAKEIHYLSLSESVRKGMKTPLYVNQFNLYLDQYKILRCRTRIANSIFPDSSKRPILLPSRNRFSELIIANCHEEVFHNGTIEVVRKLFSVMESFQKLFH